MNRVTFLCSLTLLFGCQLMAQTTLNSFENHEEVSSVVLNKPLFEIMAKVGLDTSDSKDLKFISAIDNIDSIRVFATRDKNISVALRASVDDYVHQNSFTLTNDRSGRQLFEKYDDENKNVNELLMFSEERNRTTFFWKNRRFNAIFVQLSGTNITMENVSALVEKLDLPKELLFSNN
ncbi:MAG: DUF4252 domain-containing protein [Bacteroidota bacterium]